MPNIKLTIAYEGTAYFGWQKTRSGPTIQQTLEECLNTILQESVQVEAASRTDRGVHAEGQVVQFKTETSVELRRLLQSLRGLLPKDVCVKSAEHVEDSFHPTLDSIGKEYHYHVCNSMVQLPFFRNISWHYPFELSIDEMEAATQHLIGTHDFSAFCNELPLTCKNSICQVTHIALLPLPEARLRIVIRGDRFLYKMVRNIVGTLLHIGRGKISAQATSSILTSKNRTQAGVTAPAHGLMLKKVFY